MSKVSQGYSICERPKGELKDKSGVYGNLWYDVDGFSCAWKKTETVQIISLYIYV